MENFIAKALLLNANGIIDVIDSYIAKADKDLAKTLKKEGYADAKATVKQITSMEDDISGALDQQTQDLLEKLDEADTNGVSEDELRKLLAEFFAVDGIAEVIQEASKTMYTIQIPNLANIYMQESDGELVVETIRQRTSKWIESWSEQLGELTKISTHDQISALIESTISDGKSIADLTQKIREGGWRNEQYQAKRFAVTEVLRAHSVAREESIQQSPACEEKEWKHTGAHKNEPRPNHVEMDGQIVPKNEPFTLKGRDGVTYYPMFPRDPSLPASESVNCHCTHRGVPNSDILGLPLAERQKIQAEYIKNDDKAFKKELNAKKKAEAGIEE